MRRRREEIREFGKVQKLDFSFLTHLSEMHPTSALHELCQRLGWPTPVMSIAFECGGLTKLYIFKTVVNGQTYQPSVAIDCKKAAKANSAWFALQEMGFIQRDKENPL